MQVTVLHQVIDISRQLNRKENSEPEKSRLLLWLVIVGNYSSIIHQIGQMMLYYLYLFQEKTHSFLTVLVFEFFVDKTLFAKKVISLGDTPSMSLTMRGSVVSIVSCPDKLFSTTTSIQLS